MALMIPDPEYYNAIDQIYHAQWAATKLARIEGLRRTIESIWPGGHPTSFVHVVGTSGKGSTSRFLASGLSTVGKTGAVVSPHVFDYTERIIVDGEPVGRSRVVDVWEHTVVPLCVDRVLAGREPWGFQEVTLLIALHIMAQESVRWAALEASMGGRYDLTAAVAGKAVLLTNIGDDHEAFLGKHRWQRTLDKAGIIKRECPLFTTETRPEVLDLLDVICKGRECGLFRVTPQDVDSIKKGFGAANARGQNEVNIALNADFQWANAALALAAIEYLESGVDRELILSSFGGVSVPWRFWQAEPHLYADVAHNPEKVSASVAAFVAAHPNSRPICVVGVSGARDGASVLSAAIEISRALVITGGGGKNQDPVELAKVVEGTEREIAVVPDPAEALRFARRLRKDGEYILMVGSTYTIDQALNPDMYVREINRSYGWRTAKSTDVTGTLRLSLPR